MKGIAQLKLGQIVEGNQTEAQAEQLVGNQESFLLQRALIYVRLGDSKSLLGDAQAMIVINPESAEGYFFEGLAYDPSSIQPDDIKAYYAFETARKLAVAQNKSPLLLVIQLNMVPISPNSKLKQQMQTPKILTPP